ncbi:hypothetical protein [Pseudoalteromonas peptidolytica]|uniref:Uncharacterized protein n=3 Tax=Pseudoalteromonas peptidolytica TaxID=61150 RepID=A0A8I0N0A9_9GAMM|nr:hypothetical protein [Pseudoalteromonas peptidolytica F12-50-A1]
MQQQQEADQQAHEQSQQQGQAVSETDAEQTPQDEQARNAAMVQESRPLTPEEIEKAQQLNQLLRKVPDEPAILLRNKMQLEAQKRKQRRLPRGVEKSW